jgi:Flp pilus assembly protein TadD
MDQNKGRELFLKAQDARKQGRHAEAEAHLREALLHDPGRESVRTNLCGALIDQGKHAEALGLCLDLVRDFPASAVGWHRLSLCQFETHKAQDAFDSINRCLELTPDNVDALSHRIAILLELDDTDAALETALHAVALAPQDALLHTALGVVSTARREFARTLESHLRAVQLTPDDADRRWNLALAQLMLGDLTNGWQNMEARWSNTMPVKVRYAGSAPRWDGKASLQGRRILVWAEQGLGDSIQFCRYLPQLAATGAEVILQMPTALCSLMQSLPTVASIVAEGQALPPHDFHLPLLSLPGCLDDVHVIPPPARLSPSQEKRHTWRERLGARQRPRVGLMWQGNLNNHRGLHRSLNLPELGDLFALPLDFHCVSNALSRSDEVWLRQHASSVKSYNRGIKDFSDTAALIGELDLLISIDTSTAHLGAALGVPTWVLLAYSADWRWGVGDVSPWYPQSRLFRQQKLGEWRPPIAAVQVALIAHFSLG